MGHDPVLFGLESGKRDPTDTIGLEVKAFEAGLLFTRDVGIRDFILEGDSLIIFQALSEHSLPPSSVAPIVFGLMSSTNDFHRDEFSHVKRQGYRPVNLLAKHVLDIDDFFIWIEENHCFVKKVFSMMYFFFLLNTTR